MKYSIGEQCGCDEGYRYLYYESLLWERQTASRDAGRLALFLIFVEQPPRRPPNGTSAIPSPLVFALATIGLLFLLFSISSKYAQKCLEAVKSGSWSCLCFQQSRDCKSYKP